MFKNTRCLDIYLAYTYPHLLTEFHLHSNLGFNPFRHLELSYFLFTCVSLSQAKVAMPAFRYCLACAKLPQLQQCFYQRCKVQHAVLQLYEENVAIELNIRELRHFEKQHLQLLPWTITQVKVRICTITFIIQDIQKLPFYYY